jgi:6-phosphogluconolactonase (cycloisomerase 2 family)
MRVRRARNDPFQRLSARVGAHVDMHPSGKWVYCSNRGHDSIAVYAIDQTDGSISLTAITLTGGVTPRVCRPTLAQIG